MSARLEAIRLVGKKRRALTEAAQIRHSVQFSIHTFHLRAMEQILPKKVTQNLQAVHEGKEKLERESADSIANALRDWAVSHGATHFTHWFQPLTDAQAEKHDSFLAFSENGTPIEQFRGLDLLRGEPDASSLPSGGLRSTHTARGYTAWDPFSPPFLWEGSDGTTLCIPSLYFSWKGEALDHKIPLLRSEAKIRKEALKLLELSGIQATQVFSTLGAEQEYFLIDKNFYSLRPDLILGRRTVFGAKPPKGQELEDHYFGAVKDRILSFMREFEEVAVQLGIPLKTRHNEVAPSQYEVAPIYERAPLASDHNILLMEVMRQTAEKHELACLFHEKPFAYINGSGKHCNWSLSTETGLNLLDPTQNSLLFLTMITAVIRGVWEHAGLLRSSVGSSGNDFRLGGNEAPPTILSIYLGDTLEKILEEIIHEKSYNAEKVREIDLGLSHISPHEADSSDRNRTSFFAFTGNKFEFRAVGASAHPAFPVSVINAVVSDSLNLILDEISDAIGDQSEPLSQEKRLELALPVLRKHLKLSQSVIFSGDNYSSDWHKEAEKRGLPNIQKSFHAFKELLSKKSIRAFSGILSEAELESRYEVLVERYAKEMNILANLMIELFRTQILPAALHDQKNRASSLSSLLDIDLEIDQKQLDSLTQLSSMITASIKAIDEIEKVQTQISDFGWEAKAKVFSEIAASKMGEAREVVDRLESLMDNALWPLPKYREILYHI